jgi:hypothetical protein
VKSYTISSLCHALLSNKFEGVNIDSATCKDKLDMFNLRDHLKNPDVDGMANITFPNALVQQIGNFTLANLTNMYGKCKHERKKLILL